MGKLSMQLKKYNVNISKLVEIIIKLKQEQQVKLFKYAKELLYEDKRGAVRKACQILINFASQYQIFTDHIKDISKTGLFIETKKPLFVGERIIMSFNMNGYDRPFKIKGEVVHANRFGVGIEYKGISPYVADMIGSLVERIEQNAGRG